MTKILITGASGFIGNAFLQRFASRAEFELYGVGRRELTNIPATVRYTALDLSCLDSLDFTPDVVIHAAGKAGPWGSKADYWQANVLSTEHVIDFCQRRGSPRLVYLSSAAVYYRYQHQLALTEQTAVGPTFVNDYARSKFYAEQRVRAYRGDRTILRPCAVFGQGDRLLFPPLLSAARKKRLPCLISTDSVAQGDIMFIDTLCDYLIRLVTLSHWRAVYNLSNAQPVEINTFLFDVLNRFQLPLPKKKLTVNQAMLIASTVEGIFKFFRLKREPPITCFGVGVFGYSKTLDVRAALEDLGPPSCSLFDGLDLFVKQFRDP